MPPRCKHNATSLVLRTKESERSNQNSYFTSAEKHESSKQKESESYARTNRDKDVQEVDKKYDQLQSIVKSTFDNEFHSYNKDRESHKKKTTTTINSFQENIDNMSRNRMPTIEASFKGTSNHLKNLRKRDRDLDEMSKRIQRTKVSTQKLNEYGNSQIDLLRREVKDRIAHLYFLFSN